MNTKNNEGTWPDDSSECILCGIVKFRAGEHPPPNSNLTVLGAAYEARGMSDLEAKARRGMLLLPEAGGKV